MAEMEDKIGAILGNPQMMQQIMSMAQSLGSQQDAQTQQTKKDLSLPRSDGIPDIDLSIIQRISGLAKQTNIDKREQSLLKALGAYLSKDRIGKLERAMRAAKMAQIASTALSRQGMLTHSGR